MPTCPKCGSPRVDRYCAYCGAAAVHPQAVAAPPKLPTAAAVTGRRKPQGTSLGKVASVFALAIVATLAAVAACFVVLPSARMAAPAQRTVTSPALPRDLGEYLRQFEFDADMKLATGRASLAHGSVPPSLLDERLRRAKSDLDEAFNLRERLAAASRQARLEDHWPLRVAGMTFDRPSQLQKAIDAADAYLKRGSRIEAELVSASDQVRRSQATAERTLAQMQQIRSDMHLAAVGSSPLDSVALHEKRAQFAELNAELSQTLRETPSIDWKRFDLPPFQLNP